MGNEHSSHHHASSGGLRRSNSNSETSSQERKKSNKPTSSAGLKHTYEPTSSVRKSKPLSPSEGNLSRPTQQQPSPAASLNHKSRATSKPDVTTELVPPQQTIAFIRKPKFVYQTDVTAEPPESLRGSSQQIGPDVKTGTTDKTLPVIEPIQNRPFLGEASQTFRRDLPTRYSAFTDSRFSSSIAQVQPLPLLKRNTLEQSILRKDAIRLSVGESSRKDELAVLRAQLRSQARGFEAMTVLVQYLTTPVQMNSNTSSLCEQLESCKEDLERHRHQLADVTRRHSTIVTEHRAMKLQLTDSVLKRDSLLRESSALKKQLSDSAKNEETALSDLKNHTETLVNDVTSALKEQFQVQMMRLRLNNQAVLDKQVARHGEEMNSLRLSHQADVERLEYAHYETLKKFQSRSQTEMDSLETKYQEALDARDKEHDEAIEHLNTEYEVSIESKDREHIEALNSLRSMHQGALDKLRENHRTGQDHESSELGQRSAHARTNGRSPGAPVEKDSKLSNSFLQHEVDSLRAVIELRSIELSQMRQRNTTLIKQLDEVPLLRETIAKQKQEIENLDAVINIKVDYERQLAEKHCGLLRKADRDSKALKRLSMDKEELVWRLNNSELNLNQSESSPPIDENSAYYDENDVVSASMCQLPIGSSGSRSKPEPRPQRPKSMTLMQGTSRSISTGCISRGPLSLKVASPKTAGAPRAGSYVRINSADGSSSHVQLRRPRLQSAVEVRTAESELKVPEREIRQEIRQSDV